MANGIKLSEKFKLAMRQAEFFEDFFGITPQGYTITATSGTLAAGTAGTDLSITTQAADNAVGSVIGARQSILAANRPLYMIARLQFAEAATNVANLFVGFSSSAAAAVMGDNGAGPASSYSGIGLHKIDGGLNWIAEYSVGSTQKTQELTGIAVATVGQPVTDIVAGKAAYQVIEIVAIPKSATLCDVSFLIDGVVVMRFLDQVYTSIAAMGPTVVVKSGSATAEVLLLDYIGWAHVR